MNGSSPAIVVQNLIKNFGRFAALRGISAEFHLSRLYTILGDNGAGKTTLLRTLAALLRPTHGSVTILGSQPLRSAAGIIGYMAHPSLLYDEMSALENLRYFASLYGIAGDAPSHKAIALVGLDPALSRRVGQYSQGMRQRLSLARAVVHDPRIVLLDEPFSNVDSVSAQEIVRVLGVMRDSGRTIVLVTHQAGLVESVTDEFLWMSAGQIIRRSARLNEARMNDARMNDARLNDPRLDGPISETHTGPRSESPGTHSGHLGAPAFRSTRTTAAAGSHPVASAAPQATPVVTGLLPIWFSTLRKDLRLEWRSKDAINSMLFFALLVVVIFSFAFNPTAEESRRIAGGLIWVAFLFAAVVALNQTWARELRNQVLDAYRVAPAPANSLFLAKAFGNFIFVGVLEALMTPLFMVFYNLRSIGPAYQLAIVAAAATWALVVNGTFFATISLHTRSREVMLPLILFPISIPALLAMVEATTFILTGEGSPRFWIVLLAVYDVVFTTISLLLFETVLRAE